MSKVLFLSDLHLGHEGALKWSRTWREGNSIDEHDQILIDKINSRVSKRDTLYLLGDISWRKNKLYMLDQVKCRKILVRGNHDDRSIHEYLTYFDDIMGLVKYKNSWLSHAPIHPDELRGGLNIHGHCHSNSIMEKAWKFPEYKDQWDKRYINVSVECLNGYPISYQDIINGHYWKMKVV